MRYVLLLLALAGCTTVPVTARFPENPATDARCAKLSKVSETASLSENAQVIVQNYSEYHKCAALVDTWNDWYSTQKQIFDKVK